MQPIQAARRWLSLGVWGALLTLALGRALPVEAQVLYYAQTAQAEVDDAGQLKVIRTYKVYEFTDSLTTWTGRPLSADATDPAALSGYITHPTLVAVAGPLYVEAPPVL